MWGYRVFCRQTDRHNCLKQACYVLLDMIGNVGISCFLQTDRHNCLKQACYVLLDDKQCGDIVFAADRQTDTIALNKLVMCCLI